MVNTKLMKMAVMANALSAQAASLASMILAYAEEQNVSPIPAKTLINRIKMTQKPKARKAKRGGKRTKKVAAAKVEEAPKAEDK